MRTILMLIYLAAALPAFAAETTNANAAAPVIHFAIVPQQSPRELAKRWGPVFQYLSERTGLNIQFQTANSLANFQQEMKAGQYDLTFINAYYYAAVNKDIGYKIFVQETDANFTGIMVVRKDSPIQTMADLAGKQVAYAAPTAVTTMLAHTHLKANNINYTPSYVVTMDSVYRVVAKGLFAAGQGEMRTFGNMDSEVRDQLRILWSADPLPPFAFIAHPRVPPEAAQKIQQVMIKMATDPVGAELLKAINMKGFSTPQNNEYEALRDLNLLTPEIPAKVE